MRNALKIKELSLVDVQFDKEITKRLQRDSKEGEGQPR